MMLGFAQKIFIENNGKPFWNKGKETLSLRKNSLLLNLVKVLHPFDLECARQVLAKSSLLANDELFIALVYIFSAIRQGHLCISCCTLITPTVESIFNCCEDNSKKLTNYELGNIKSSVTQGLKSIIETISTNKSLFPFVFEENSLYLQRNWLLETIILKEFHRISLAKTFELKNQENISLLNDQQRLAIDTVLKSSFTLITGGPGTGKTFTAAHLITCFLNQIKNKKKNIRVIVTAPTGKAVANIEEKLMSNPLFQSFEEKVQVKTLHALLIGSNKEEHYFVEADLVLVDESSMIDAALMAEFLSSIKSGTKIVFIGDPNQLPPVESGSIFSDMVLFMKENGQRALVELNKSHRTSSSELLEFSSFVKNGNSNKAIKYIRKSSFALTLFENIKLNKVLDFVIDNFSEVSLEEDSPSNLLNAFDGFRLLSPMKQGVLGIDNLNKALFEHEMKKQIKFEKRFVPIMITKNDYEKNLFNGDTGVLVLHNKSSLDYAYFDSRDKNIKYRKVSKVLLHSYDLAFCISIHKSQGSEWNHVVVILPDGSEVFGRELLYTAATRSKNKLTLFAEPETLSKLIASNSFRNSNFVKRMRSL